MTDDELKAMYRSLSPADIAALLAEVEMLHLADKVARVQTRAHEETIGSLRARVAELEGCLREAIDEGRKVTNVARDLEGALLDCRANYVADATALKARVAELEEQIKSLEYERD